MNPRYHCSTLPADIHLRHIIKWLTDEPEDSEGFRTFNDMPEIIKGFHENRVITIDDQESAIGFLVWSDNSPVIRFEYFSIRSDSRNKGLARRLVEFSCSYFASKGFGLIDLHCAPPKTNLFWSRVGFVQSVKKFSKSRFHMYRPLTALGNPEDYIDP